VIIVAENNEYEQLLISESWNGLEAHKLRIPAGSKK
jgi:hypothetical protein